MIRVTLRIPLDPYSFIEIHAKASNPIKIMESLEAMVKAMHNKTATVFWDKYFRFNETTFLTPGEKTTVVEKTIIKGKETPAIVNPDDRYNFLNQHGKPYICKQCGGIISWDKYPDVKHPIHVNDQGKIQGDGSCPNFG